MGRSAKACVALALVATLVPALALAQVPLPALYYGNVTITGPARMIPVPVGVVVSARVGGVEKGSITVTEAGKYGGPGGLEPKLLVQDNIPPNSTIEFYVGGVRANETDNFKSGEIKPLDLTATDNIAPVSSVDAITPYWRTSVPFAVTATASDLGASVDNVELFYRYSSDNSAWGSWTSFGLDTASPWSWQFTAPSGDGFYEFYSIARDKVGNVENAPAAADARCGVDRASPSAPALRAPVNGAILTTLTPTFYWSAVVDLSGVTYTLQIDNENTFSAPLKLQKENLLENSYALAAAENLPEGTYYWRVGAKDGACNPITWSSPWSFTISLVPPPVVRRDVFKYPRITPEAPGTAFGENTIITELTINTVENVENVRVTVEEHEDRPTGIAIGIPDLVYRYIEFIKENIQDNQISSVTIKFRVEKSWITNNGIDETTIAMYRWDPATGTWNALPTTKIGEDATYVYFQCTSPGLSWFAVAGRFAGVAAFRLSDLRIEPKVVDPDEIVTISVRVTNIGALEGTRTVVLKINGATKRTRSVTLLPGASTTVTFIWSESVPGTYDVEVDGQRGYFTVRLRYIPPPPVVPAWLLISLAVVVAMVLVAAYAIKVRS